MVPALPRWPPFSTPLPVRSISPPPSTVTVPLLMVALLSVSVPSTVVCVLATVEPWSIASAADASTLSSLLAVTVSPCSALPLPLTLTVPLLPRWPPFSTPLPVRSISPPPSTVTVPLLMLALLSVSVPSTVVWVLATVEPWSIASAADASTSSSLLAVTVSPCSALPVPLTLMVPALPRWPPFSTPVPVRSISPPPSTVTVPLLMVALLSVSVPSTVVCVLATVEPWSIASAADASTSSSLLPVTVSPCSALPVPLALMVPALPRWPPFSTPLPVRSISPPPSTVAVPLLMVALLSVSVPSTVVCVLATVEPWSIASAADASTSSSLLAVTVSPCSALPVPLAL